MDIDAESVGHDLMWGTANYRRNVQDRTATGTAEETAGPGAGETETDDLPADLDLETGELAGTDSGEPLHGIAGIGGDAADAGSGSEAVSASGTGAAAAEDGPDDPFVMPGAPVAAAGGRGRGRMGG